MVWHERVEALKFRLPCIHAPETRRLDLITRICVLLVMKLKLPPLTPVI